MFFIERKGLKEKIFEHAKERNWKSTSDFINYAVERTLHEPDQMQNLIAETKKSHDLLYDELHNQLYAIYVYISELYRYIDSIEETENEHFTTLKVFLKKFVTFMNMSQKKIELNQSLEENISSQFENIQNKLSEIINETINQKISEQSKTETKHFEELQAYMKQFASMVANRFNKLNLKSAKPLSQTKPAEAKSEQP